jgi:hypothetical protein
MVPQEELDRALGRWRARVHGHEVPPAVVVQIPAADPTLLEGVPRVETSTYQESGNVVADVKLDDGDFEDYNSSAR